MNGNSHAIIDSHVCHCRHQMPMPPHTLLQHTKLHFILFYFIFFPLGIRVFSSFIWLFTIFLAYHIIYILFTLANGDGRNVWHPCEVLCVYLSNVFGMRMLHIKRIKPFALSIRQIPCCDQWNSPWRLCAGPLINVNISIEGIEPFVPAACANANVCVRACKLCANVGWWTNRDNENRTPIWMDEKVLAIEWFTKWICERYSSVGFLETKVFGFCSPNRIAHSLVEIKDKNRSLRNRTVFKLIALELRKGLAPCPLPKPLLTNDASL